MFRMMFTTATALGVIATGAAASTTAFATTDLNLRAGPGPQYQIVDVIAGEDPAIVEGCIADANWCKVSYDGQEGWAYGSYLTAALGEGLPIYGAEAAAPVPTVQYQVTETYESPSDAGAALGSTAGAVMGSLIGGPAAVGAGFILGGLAGATADPEEVTITYVEEHPLEPVYVQGEVVLGARIPAEVALTPVPDSDYSYVALNNNVVLVEPVEREIVYIVR